MSSCRCTEARYRSRSAWTRGPRTAAPLLPFSIRRWIAAASAARAIIPSRASISRTRWPLPNPPMAGLQDISPIRTGSMVTRATRAPRRAAAAAASVPACPPPTTMTSNCVMAPPLSDHSRAVKDGCSTWNVLTYLPMQKPEKSVSNMASVAFSPVNSVRANNAERTSSARSTSSSCTIDSATASLTRVNISCWRWDRA